MELVESERLELKQCVTERLCKTIIAFANGSGGRIYIGIDDFGALCGVPNRDREMLRASNLVKDCIRPDITQLVTIEPVELDSAPLIRIDVEAGTSGPYYLAAKGLTPSGVFARLGPATVPLSREDIRKLIRDADQRGFESLQSPLQDLTFIEATRVCSAQGITLSQTTMENLGFIGPDGFYTNLALLVSDQNPSIIRCGTFNDDTYSELIARKDLSGSILRQIEEAELFLGASNALRSYFVPGSAQRFDKRDYPEQAIREALVNIFTHRDYEDETPALVKMNRTAMRFTNYGGLFKLTAEQALAGISKSRNPRLQQLLFRLHYVEALGTGLPSIWDAYKPEELAPSIDADTRWFTLTLPNVNTTRNPLLSPRENKGPSLRGEAQDYLALSASGALPPDGERAFAASRRNVATRANEAPLAAMHIEKTASLERAGHRVERVLIELGRNQGGSFTRQEAEDALGAGRDVALKVINGLLESGQLEKTGKARATRYHVVG